MAPALADQLAEQLSQKKTRSKALIKAVSEGILLPTDALFPLLKKVSGFQEPRALARALALHTDDGTLQALLSELQKQTPKQYSASNGAVAIALGLSQHHEASERLLELAAAEANRETEDSHYHRFVAALSERSAERHRQKEGGDPRFAQLLLDHLPQGGSNAVTIIEANGTAEQRNALLDWLDTDEVGLFKAIVYVNSHLSDEELFERFSPYFTNGDDSDVGDKRLLQIAVALGKRAEPTLWLPFLRGLLSSEAPPQVQRHALLLTRNILQRCPDELEETADALLSSTNLEPLTPEVLSFFQKNPTVKAVPWLLESLTIPEHAEKAFQALHGLAPGDAADPVLQWSEDHSPAETINPGAFETWLNELSVHSGAPLEATPELLQQLVEKVDAEGVRAVLDNGVDPNERVHGRPYSALHLAVYSLANKIDPAQVLEITGLLTAAGADPKARLDWPWTPSPMWQFSEKSTPMTICKEIRGFVSGTEHDVIDELLAILKS